MRTGEILQALAQCAKNACYKCPYYKTAGCRQALLTEARDLIIDLKEGSGK